MLRALLTALLVVTLTGCVGTADLMLADGGMMELPTELPANPTTTTVVDADAGFVGNTGTVGMPGTTNDAGAISNSPSTSTDAGSSLPLPGSTPDAGQATGTWSSNSTGSGSCPVNSTGVNGQCVCNAGYQPNATATACDPVTCPANSTMTNGQCQCNAGYQPNAALTACEPIPSSCPANSSQTAAGCVCNAGYVPNAGYTGCVKLGGSCGAATDGYCAGDVWVRCEPEKGWRAMDCGYGNCKTVQQGWGACRCGAVTTDGVCQAQDGSWGGKGDTWFTCLETLDLMVARNCRASTGNTNATCGTAAGLTSFMRGCFIAPCKTSTDGYVSSTCNYGGTCSVDTATNTHYCSY